MAFDAGMLAAQVHEICSLATGGKIEKIYMPEKDEIIIQLRSFGVSRRLLINAGCNTPRIGFTEVARENPDRPPMLCMLLRKHLSGGRLVAVTQYGFERACELKFTGHDEMGFETDRYIIAEIMGKYSNLIFADENKKILSVLKPVDFSQSSLRQLLPGMTYELPPKQDRLCPINASAEDFIEAYTNAPKSKAADKFISGTYMGISAAVAREIAYRACGRTDATLSECDAECLYLELGGVVDIIKSGTFTPCLVRDTNGLPVEYCFFPLAQYGSGSIKTEILPDFAALLDNYFGARDRDNKIKQHAADLLRLLTNAETRIVKKLTAQKSELADCAKGEEYRKKGELIKANLYKIKPGSERVTLTDYTDYKEDGSYGKVTITLDKRLSPSDNAAGLFKKYTKCKTAEIELARQISLGEAELDYIHSVFDELSRALTVSDMNEIREELYTSGYASKMSGYASAKSKSAKPEFMRFKTTNGFTVICGKNNIQNDYITHKLAERSDIWFHVKGSHGSHAVLFAKNTEPPEADYTDAAEIAAYYSKNRGGQNIPVDYTHIRNLKKPVGAKPGFVIYHTNYTAYVTPIEDKIMKMKVK